MIHNIPRTLMILALVSHLSACQSISKSASKTTNTFASWLGLKSKVPKIDAHGMVDMSKTSLEQMQELRQNMPADQWVYLENDLQGIYTLQNKSKDGYILSFKLNCKRENQKTGFNILDQSGQVILAVPASHNTTIQFLLDNKNYANPFIEINPKKLERFKADLKTTQVIKIFNSSKLYKFQNNKVQLLDKPVSCSV